MARYYHDMVLYRQVLQIEHYIEDQKQSLEEFVALFDELCHHKFGDSLFQLLARHCEENIGTFHHSYLQPVCHYGDGYNILVLRISRRLHEEEKRLAIYEESIGDVVTYQRLLGYRYTAKDKRKLKDFEGNHQNYQRGREQIRRRNKEIPLKSGVLIIYLQYLGEFCQGSTHRALHTRVLEFRVGRFDVLSSTVQTTHGVRFFARNCVNGAFLAHTRRT